MNRASTRSIIDKNLTFTYFFATIPQETELTSYWAYTLKRKENQMAATIKINFHKAAQRHFDDAELLFEHERRANAGHLYGFAAECGIKAFLGFCGLIETDTDGDIPSKSGFKTHMNQLANKINLIHSLANGRLAAKYLTLIPDIADFCDWRVEHRYYDESKLPLTSINQWQISAKQVMMMLDQANIDGVIQ